MGGSTPFLGSEPATTNHHPVMTKLTFLSSRFDFIGQTLRANGTQVTVLYAILENGHRVEGNFKVGNYVSTQWGWRKVVSNHSETIDTAPTEPAGV